MWLYTIYYQPETWPPYRVRAFVVASGTSAPHDVLGVAASLELARLLVPPVADTPMPRAESDAPEIVETWI